MAKIPLKNKPPATLLCCRCTSLTTHDVPRHPYLFCTASHIVRLCALHLAPWDPPALSLEKLLRISLTHRRQRYYDRVTSGLIQKILIPRSCLIPHVFRISGRGVCFSNGFSSPPGDCKVPRNLRATAL